MKASVGSYPTADTNMRVRTVEGHTQRLDALRKALLYHFTCKTGNQESKARTPVMLAKILPWLDRNPNTRMADLLRRGFSERFLVPSFNDKGCSLVKKFAFSLASPQYCGR